MLALIAALAAFYMTRPAQSTSPVRLSQDIAEITALASHPARLEYLMIAQPLSEYPRYLFKYKDAPEIHVVKVPSISHVNIEREVLLRNAIPYSFASDDYLAAHQAIFADEERRGSALAIAQEFMLRNAVGIAMLVFLFFTLKNGLPGMGISASVIKPESLKGSMDDLVGMADIKQEVAHLEEMILNRSLYRSHNIDKPFKCDADRPGRHWKNQAGRLFGQKTECAANTGIGLRTGIGPGRGRLQDADVDL